MVTVKEFFLRQVAAVLLSDAQCHRASHSEIFCVPSLNPKNSLFLTYPVGYIILSNQADFFNGMRRFRLRRLWRVNSEALRIAAGLNLKRLLKKRGWRHRPEPAAALSAFFLAAFWRLAHPWLVSVSVSSRIRSSYIMNKGDFILSC